MHLAGKRQKLHQFTKKVRKIKKKTIGQSEFYQSYQKYLKELRIMSAAFFENIFNKQQCGFRKGYNTQQCLRKMLEQRQTTSQWRQINALAGIAPFTNMNKMRILMNSFFRSQFNYCPLTWMCHNRKSSRKRNRLHERCLTIIRNDKQLSLIINQLLLQKDNSVSIH